MAQRHELEAPTERHIKRQRKGLEQSQLSPNQKIKYIDFHSSAATYLEEGENVRGSDFHLVVAY